MQKITQAELADLIIANKSRMYQLAFSIVRNDADAQDAVGEAIVLAFEKAHQLRQSASAKAWLMQILVNAAKQIVMRSHRFVPYVEDEENGDGQVSVFERDGLWESIMELEREFREVVILYYYEQFSVKEIGKMLKIPDGTVKSRLARARRKLLRMINE